ncbi:MAG: protein translocase subunit SecD [Peptostreptococcales bacterium]|jgi:preprotein translocase subunit SecD
MKKVLAILIVILMVFGWVVSISGLTVGNLEIRPLQDLIRLGLDLKGGVYVVLEAETNLKDKALRDLMNQTQQVVERRVNSMGLSEPNVTIEGDNRIRVELPGVKNSAEAIVAIGQTAQLQFMDYRGNVILTGSEVKDARLSYDPEHPSRPVVSLEFTSEGAKAFKDATTRTSQVILPPQSDSTYMEKVAEKTIFIVLDNEVISNPIGEVAITNGQAVIQGSFTVDEAANLAALIRGGALPVNLKEVQSSEIGATLGQDSLYLSVLAGAIGMGIIILFMLVYYKVLGISAGIGLLLYTLLVAWIMVAFKAVLTLPGIAGIILSIGMAVDANVIIFERIKEELANGKTIRVSIKSGFQRAMTTILDSNITTIIAGVVLYYFGSGPVRGFAVTLIIGILVSMFTAVLITRLYIHVISDIKALNKKSFYGIKEVKV